MRVSDCCCLSWQWVVFRLRLGWVHTLRYISYASLYDRFLFLTLSFVSLCSTLTGIFTLVHYSQPHPSNTIDFGWTIEWVCGLSVDIAHYVRLIGFAWPYGFPRSHGFRQAPPGFVLRDSVSDCCGLSWQWVGFVLRLGWVHTLRYISYASLYDRFQYSSLRSSHFVQPYGYIPIPVIQPQPSNIIRFRLC